MTPKYKIGDILLSDSPYLSYIIQISYIDDFKYAYYYPIHSNTTYCMSITDFEDVNHIYLGQDLEWVKILYDCSGCL